MYLHSFIHYIIQHFAPEYFQHGAFNGVFFCCPEQRFVERLTALQQFLLFFVYPFGGAVQGAFGCPHPDGHFSDLMFDSAELCYGLFELLTGIRIFNRGSSCRFGSA